MDNSGVRSNGGFRMLTPNLQFSWDPSVKGMPVQPPSPRFLTTTLGPIMANHGAIANGMMTTGAFIKAIGSFTVADNNFADPSELILGPYRLVNGVDYVVGATDGDTATNIATAISKIPGFSASANLTVVSVECDAQADDVPFKAINYGDTESLGSFTGDGYLTKGIPQAGPPIQQ